MAFTKGTSGNPRGRPPKPRAKGESALRASLLSQAPEILAALVEQARGGDVAAAKVLLDRCLPPLRPTDQPVSLAMGDLPDAARSIIAALSSGRLTPSQAQQLSSVIASLAQSVATLQFEDRLAALESAANAPQLDAPTPRGT